MTKSRSLKVVLGLLLVVAATAAAPAASEPQLASGSLDLQAAFVLVSDPFPCPADAPSATTDCRARIGTGVVRGLGIVSVTYFWPLGLGPPTCPADFAKLLATSGRLIVAGNGEITFTIAEGARCVWFPAMSGPLDAADERVPRNEPQEFTITGGTGPFASASGRGKLEQRWFSWSRVPDVGGETWTGTLEVPGLAFDVTAPKLSGATARMLRAPKKGAKSARVTFKVTATDDVDGTVSASCLPQSGSRFEVGRTKVRCAATDASGNTATAAFTVTVKPPRATAQGAFAEAQKRCAKGSVTATIAGERVCLKSGQKCKSSRDWQYHRYGFHCHTGRLVRAAKPKPSDAVSRKVDVGGYRLAITCRGKGSPTVILESGGGASAEAWFLLERIVAKTTRVCSYDRAGLGVSEPRRPPGPVPAARVVEELHTLLAGAGISPPYVLGGWSLGGFFNRLYTKRYPDEVVGLVAVDGTPIGLPGEPSWMKLPGQPPIDLIGGPGFPDSYYYAAADAELAAAPDLGSRPLVVLTHGRSDGIPDDFEALWKIWQRRVALLSTSSILVRVDFAGHGIQFEAPDLTAEAFGLVIAAVRAERPLPVCSATRLPELFGTCLDPSGQADSTAKRAPAVQGAAEARRPDSVRLFQAWLAAFNSGDRARYARFLKRSFPTWAPLIDQDLGLREFTGGFDLRKLGRVSATRVSGWVEERDSDQFASFVMWVSAAKRPKILSLLLAPIPRPAAFPIPRLTDGSLPPG